MMDMPQGFSLGGKMSRRRLSLDILACLVLLAIICSFILASMLSSERAAD